MTDDPDTDALVEDMTDTPGSGSPAPVEQYRRLLPAAAFGNQDVRTWPPGFPLAEAQAEVEAVQGETWEQLVAGHWIPAVTYPAVSGERRLPSWWNDEGTTGWTREGERLERDRVNWFHPGHVGGLDDAEVLAEHAFVTLVAACGRKVWTATDPLRAANDLLAQIRQIALDADKACEPWAETVLPLLTGVPLGYEAQLARMIAAGADLPPLPDIDTNYPGDSGRAIEHVVRRFGSGRGGQPSATDQL